MMKTVTYCIPFLVTKNINKRTCIKVKENVLEHYDQDNSFKTRYPEEWARYSKNLLNSTFDVISSLVTISANGMEICWHLHNLDRARFEDEVLDDPCYVTREQIDDSIVPFAPEKWICTAPEIGSEGYVWHNGHVLHVKISKITFERYVDNQYDDYVRINFEDAQTGESSPAYLRVEHGDNLFYELLKIWRDTPDGFDNAFWEAKYEELRKEKDEEYAELTKEYESYKSYY